MNEIILNTNLPSKRTRLTREELLAGKCSPDDPSQAASDPRIKTPDDVLIQRLVRTVTPELSAAQASIAELQKRYETEIAAWREYENKVQAWKKDVTEILEQYKHAANEREILSTELQKAQNQLKQHEHELNWLRQQLPLPSASER